MALGVYGAMRAHCAHSWEDRLAHPIPQEGVNYGIQYKELWVLARRDGIVIQPMSQGEDTGWNDDNEEPSRDEAEGGVRRLQELYSRMAKIRRSG